MIYNWLTLNNGRMCFSLFIYIRFAVFNMNYIRLALDFKMSCASLYWDLVLSVVLTYTTVTIVVFVFVYKVTFHLFYTFFILKPLLTCHYLFLCFISLILLCLNLNFPNGITRKHIWRNDLHISNMNWL